MRNAIAKIEDGAPAWAEGLTDRERRFVEEYLVDLSARQAAIWAGLGKTAKSASEIASRMRRKQSVATAIAKLLAERAGATSSRIIEELGKIAFADVTDIVKVKGGVVPVTDTDQLSPDQRASIAEISETVGEGGRTIKVKMVDKIQALDRLARAVSLYKDRTEISGPKGGPIEMSDAKVRLMVLLGLPTGIVQPQPMVEVQPPLRRITAPKAPVVRVIDAD